MGKETVMDLQFTYERHSDLLHVDALTPPVEAQIDVVEVGEAAGFPGQVYIRVDSETGEVYGMTIHNYTGMRRALLFERHMLRARKFLAVLFWGIRAGSVNDRRLHSQIA